MSAYGQRVLDKVLGDATAKQLRELAAFVKEQRAINARQAHLTAKFRRCFLVVRKWTVH